MGQAPSTDVFPAITPTYSTIPHVSCHVPLLHQTNAYISGPRSVGADEIKNRLSEFEDDIRDMWLMNATYTGAYTFPICGFLPNQFSSTSQHRILIDHCSQLYIKKNSRAAPITNKVTNSSAERLPHHPTILQYRLLQPFTSPPFPSHPEISMPIDRRSECSLMASECHQARVERTERSQRVSFIARHPAMTTD